MRIILAVLFAVGILLVVQCFTWFQASIPMAAVEQFMPERAEGKFALDVTLTFQAEPDPFDFDAVSLRIRRGDEVLLERREPVAAGRPVTIADLPNMTLGRNEFFVTASVPANEPNQEHAVRVRILRDGQPIARRTLWSAPGEPVQGIVVVDLPGEDPSANPAEDTHEKGS